MDADWCLLADVAYIETHLFKYYFDLEEVMGRRLGNEPLDTAETAAPQPTVAGSGAAISQDLMTGLEDVTQDETERPALASLTQDDPQDDMDDFLDRVDAALDDNMSTSDSPAFLEPLSVSKRLDIASFSPSTAKALNLPKNPTASKSKSQKETSTPSKRTAPESLPLPANEAVKKPSGRENSITQMIRSSLPDKSVLDETRKDNAKFNETQEKIAEHMKGSTSSLMSLLEAKLGGPARDLSHLDPAEREKRAREQDEVSRLELEVKKKELEIKRAKLEAEDEEQKTLKSRSAALALAKEKATMIAQFVAAGMSADKALEQTNSLLGELEKLN